MDARLVPDRSKTRLFNPIPTQWHNSFSQAQNPGLERFGFLLSWKRKIRPFIYQKQASRKLKAYISESPEIIREIGSDDIQPNFREALKRFDFSVPINSIADVFRLHEH